MTRNLLFIPFVLLYLLLPAGWLGAQEQQEDYAIIITTPGYGSVYRYTRDDFSAKAREELRIQNGSVALHEDSLASDQRRVYVTIGLRRFDFLITPQMPLIRLTYDRNRRLFAGAGCNYLDREASFTPPSLNGTSLDALPAQWEAEINRRITDRTLLPADRPAVFILEADIDENGMVQKVTEIGGGLRQYAQVIIDYFYDRAVRGWEPAKRNGAPFRALAQLRFELKR